MSELTLPPDFSFLNRLQGRLQQQPRFDLSRFKFVDSNVGEIIEEEEFEDVVDEEIMEEADEEEVEEYVNESIIEEAEEDISVNMETRMESSEFVEYDINVLNEGYQQQETSGRGSRTARMRVNTNYIHYTVQVPQSFFDDTYTHEIEDEEEEEMVEEEEDINELIVDEQDMSEYFEKSIYYGSSVMDIDVNRVADDEEQAACAICLLEYKDEDAIATLECGHEFHVECINKWLHRKKSCPFCRVSVLPHNT